MMTDAELNVLYGAGLKPATAMRVIDELRRVKAELLDWQIRAECWNSEAVEAVERLNAVRDLAREHWQAGLGSASDYDKGLARMAYEVLDILG